MADANAIGLAIKPKKRAKVVGFVADEKLQAAMAKVGAAFDKATRP